MNIQKIAPAIIVLLLGIGIFGYVSQNNTASTEPVSETGQELGQASDTQLTSNEDGTIVSYQGVSGTSAMDVLKNSADVATEESSFGEFVTAINGIDGGDDKYWMFYVNGEPAQVGAGDYVTTSTDTIEWRLE